MNLSSFWEFLVLSEVKNYSEAAAELSLSESSLSRHIKSMEYELGVLLFNREPKSISLTEYGEAMIPYAKEILSIQAKYRQKLRDIESYRTNSLSIMSCYNVRSLINDYSNSNSIYSVKYESVSSQSVEELLRHNKADIVFSYFNGSAADDIEYMPFRIDQFVAVLANHHHLSQRKSIALSELQFEDFIVINTHESETNDFVNYCHKAGFEPRIISYTPTAAGMANLLKYHGVSLLLKRLVEKDNFPDITFVPLNPPIMVDVRIMYLKSKADHPYIRNFLNYVKNNCPPDAETETFNA